MELLSVDEQILNLLVKVGQQPSWLLSAVYASLKPSYRQDLWQYLSLLGCNLDLPWLLTGDFNQILTSLEKKGGRQPLRQHMGLFQNMIEACGLIDLGIEGLQFTWSNRRKGQE